MDTIRILLVDDDHFSREPMRDWLLNLNFLVDEAVDCEEALSKVREQNGNYDVALIDQVLGSGRDGIETMKEMHKLSPHIQAIIFTGWGDQKSGVRALQEGAYRYLLKPVDPEEVDILIRSVIESRKVQRKLELTKREKEWLDTLLKVTQIMQRQMGDREKVLETIAEAGKSLTNADEFAICIINPMTNEFSLTHAGNDDLYSKPFRKAIREIGRLAMAKKKPEYIPDTTIDDRVGPVILEGNIHSMVAVPINGQGILYSFGFKTDQFRDEAVHLMEMLGSEAAIVIDNANLFLEKEQRVKELEKLREVGTLMAEVVEPNEVLHRIAEGVMVLLKADSAVIWPYESSRKRFVMERVTVAGLTDADYQIMKQPLVGGGGITDTIRRVGFRFVENVENPDYRDFIGKIARNFYHQTGIKCFAGIDLKVGEEIVGVLYLNFNKQTILSTENENTLKAFASEAALAIKKARLYRQVQSTLKHLETTADFMRLGNVSDVLKSVVEGVKEALNCDAVTLYKYDENKQIIDGPPVTIGLIDEAAASNMENLGPDSTLGKILHLREYYTEESLNDEIMYGQFIARERVCCSAGIALRIVDHTVGILFINYRTPYHFTDDDRQLFHTFAALAAIAIRNAELYEAGNKWSQHLTHLYEAGKAVSVSVKRDEILETLLDQALEITGISGTKALFGNMITYLSDSNEMMFTHARPAGELKAIRQKLGERISIDNNTNRKIGITGKAIKTQKSQLIPDVNKDNDYLTYHPETKAEIAVPLIDRGKVIGVLNVEHSKKHGLDMEDLKALEMLATHAVVAIQKAEQFEELKKTQRILAGRTALAFMGMASSTWQHEINKYAAIIADNTSLLQKELESSVFRWCRPFLKKVKRVEEYAQTITKLVQLIHKTPITAPLSSEEGVSSIQVNSLLQERVSRILERNEVFNGMADIEVKWEIELPDEARVTISREWFRRAIDIMITNALDAMEKISTPKILTIKTLVTKKLVAIHFLNTGNGIPQEVMKRLFNEPIPKKEGEKGFGMGLLLAQQILQTYKGEIRLIVPGPPVTEFVISLPLENGA